MAAVDRNRKKLVVAAAVGAVGAAGAAAAYYGYSRFMSWKDALTDTFLPRLADSRDDGLYCRGTRKDADAHLQQHFQTIQDISDSTTLPQMLPTLQTNLAKNADVNTLHQRLKRGKLGGHYLTPTEKQATWNELKVETFTYTLSAVWLLPMLDLLLRIQLNILGRHLYLQNAMDVKHAQNSWGSWAGRQKAPPRLTERA
jgi:peroxin-3